MTVMAEGRVSIGAEDRALALAIQTGTIHDSQGFPAYRIAKTLDHILFSTLEFYRSGDNDNSDLTLIVGGMNNWFSWITNNWQVRPKTIRDHQDQIEKLHARFSRILEEGQRLDQRVSAEVLAQQNRESERRALVNELFTLKSRVPAQPLASSYDPNADLNKSNEWLVAKRQELAAEHEYISRESLRLGQERDEIQAKRGF